MYARVATFEGGDPEAIRAAMKDIDARAAQGPPEGVPGKAFLMLHQADEGKVMAIGIVETEADYDQADKVLNEMDPPSGPGSIGRRVSVERWEVGTKQDAP